MHVTTFVPMQLSMERRYNRDIARPDVVFVEVAPPDENGLCCTGPQGAGQLGDLWMFGKKIIAQINRNCPRVFGHPDIFIPVGKFDAIVEEDSDFHCIVPSVPGETDKKIAANITPLIPDGATIQLGIGGMANAIGYALEDHRDLGVHTEMFVESMVYLQKKGIINNSQKTYMKERVGRPYKIFKADSDAEYDEEYRIDLAEIEPTVSYPHLPENTRTISAAEKDNIKIDQAVIGSCTAVSQNLPIITVIMNNGVLGMVYQWQTIFCDRRYSGTDPHRKTDFVKLGEGFGVKTYRAKTRKEYDEALKEAMKNSGPSWWIIIREEAILQCSSQARISTRSSI